MQQIRTIRMAMMLVAFLLVSFAASLVAQLSTGKIEGYVRDSDTGLPLAGAQVVVNGTRLGNVTNKDGYYFILNVPPGDRSLTVTHTGYQKTTIASNMILAGQTTTINFKISSTVVELEGITIEGEAEILMPRDNTVSKQRMTAEQISEMPATKLEDLMVLEAGVQSGGADALSRGLRIRGGRVGEEAMVIDGVTVRNYTANQFRDFHDIDRESGAWVWQQEVAGLGEDATPLDFSTGAVEEVDIITGGFQAEFGNAQSGIINIVTREGGATLDGHVRFTTDEQNPRTSDYGYNQLQVGIGGPIPIVPNLYFYGSGEIQGMADRQPTHADEGFRGVNQDFVDHLNNAVINDPDLNLKYTPFTLEEFRLARESYGQKTGTNQSLFSPGNPVRQPLNWLDRSLASGKITYSPVTNLKLISSINFSRIQNSYPQKDNGNYFYDGVVTRDQLPYAPWQERWGNVDQIVIAQSYARRTRTSNLLAGFDWDFLKRASGSASLQFRYNNMRNQDINSATPKVNWKRDTFMSWALHDVQFENEVYPNREWPFEAADKRRYFPDGETGWHRTWTVPTPFYQDDRSWLYFLTYRYLREQQDNFKADLDVQLNRQNRAKLGMQYTKFTNRMFDIHAMHPTRDIQNEFAYSPDMLALYVQNRTDLGDFVLDYGLRYDAFRPKTNWGIRNGDQWGQDYSPKTISEFSPRFDVAFPVTDKAQMRFAYGVFTQLPSLSFIFNGENPGDLGYSRSDAFEAGVSYLASDDIVLDLVAYYRDVMGNVAEKEFFRDYWQYHSERRIRGYETGYTNRDNGNIKGVDLSLKKRFSNNFALNLYYTLQFSRTTGSQYSSTYNWANYLDPSTGETFTPPDELRPINGDQTHKISANFNYVFPEDYRGGSTLGLILKDVRINPVLTLSSGEPLYSMGGQSIDYTWMTELDGKPIGGLNFFRGKWNTNLDLRVSKMFRLAGKRNLSFSCEIFNALNHKFNYQYPRDYSYEDYADQTGGLVLDWNDPNLSDLNSSRFQTDFNQDGILTLDEAAKGAMAYDMMFATMNKNRWGLARQIRLGASFDF